MTDAEILTGIAPWQDRIVLNKRHQYHVDGNPTFGTTSIINVLDKPGLLGWAARLALETGDVNAHRKKKDDAAKQGTNLHTLIEHECHRMMGRIVPDAAGITDEQHRALARWRFWAQEVGFKPIATEFRVYHSKLNYAGTVDVLAYVRGGLVVTDWKSGGIYSEAGLQSSAYRAALADMLGIEAFPGLVVSVPRDGDTISEWGVEAPSLEACMRAFAGLIEAYKWRREADKVSYKGRVAAA